MNLPSLKIRNFEISTPIIQGGMGIGLSNFKLAGTVSANKGLGVLSSAALDLIVSKRHNKKLNTRNACAQDIIDTKSISQNNPIGINIMVAVMKQYSDSVLGSIDGGINAIISGAGLPLNLPEIVDSHSHGKNVALIPIVSSKRALNIILKKWQKYRLPDAIVIEGPLAGGHIGWRKISDTLNKNNSLENIVNEIINFLKENNLDIPVIAAGGIYNHQDIKKIIEQGCIGAQLGTRFLATYESGASEKYKETLIHTKKDDIILTEIPGSPCGMLFRIIKDSPFYLQNIQKKRPPACTRAYLLNSNNFCLAKESAEKAFCICNGLLNNIDLGEDNQKELYTVGYNAFRINKIISVSELMEELTNYQSLKNKQKKPNTNINKNDKILNP